MATSMVKPETSKTATPKAASAAKKSSKPAKATVAKTKPATAKSPATKTTAVKSNGGARKISAEERYRMTEVAAYFVAEHNSFAGNPVDFWIAAEAQVSAMLGKK